MRIQMQYKIHKFKLNFMQIEDHPTFASPVGLSKSSFFGNVSTGSSSSEDKSLFKFSDHIISEFPSPCDDSTYKFSKFGLSSHDKREKKADRFIPMRKTSSFETHIPEEKENEENVKGKEIKENKVSVEEVYRSMVLGDHNKKIFSFMPLKDQGQNDPTGGFNKFGFINQNQITKKPSSYRKISKTPFKVLDAPNLQDDFYLNLVDWSKQNVLGVALGSCIYLWDANTNKVCKFCDMAPQSTVTSIGWNPKGSHLSVGNSLGDVEIWDVNKSKRVVSLYGHSARVTSLAWSSSILASGSRDKSILYRDIREDSKKIVNRILHHTQQVCGLKWSFDEQSLASGGNDNKLFVWNTRSNIPVSKFSDHVAAVKAIAWSPHLHGLLASGGGSADRTIRFWNVLTNKAVDSIDTGSQVCNLMFSTNTPQLVSTHGYSQNEIIVWKYPSLQKVTTLTGHTSRVLYLAMNPKGETIVTGAGDETLRFWNVFPGKTRNLNTQNDEGRMLTMELR